jgi:hypothetical protein
LLRVSSDWDAPGYRNLPENGDAHIRTDDRAHPTAGAFALRINKRGRVITALV